MHRNSGMAHKGQKNCAHVNSDNQNQHHPNINLIKILHQMKKLLLFLCAVMLSFTASAADYTSWYVNVLGDFNGWSDNGIQPNAEGITTHTNLPIGTKSFKVKIWNGSDIWLSTGGAINIDEPTVINGNNDSNMTIAGAEEGEKFDVTFDCATNTITVKRASGEEPPVDYTQWYVNVPGDYNAWQDNGVQANEEGIATQEALPIGNSLFKIKVWNGSSDIWLSTGGEIALDTPTVIEGNNDPGMTIAGAVSGESYNIVFDCSTNTITVSKAGGDVPPVDYTSWYVTVIGEFNGWNGTGLQPNEEGVVTHEGLAIGNTEFKIKVWNGSDIYYSNGGEIETDTPVVIGYENDNMKIAGAQPGEKFNVTFDCATRTLTVTSAGAADYTTWYVNVIGEFNDWQDNGVAANEEGVAVHEALPIGTSQFKIKIWNGSDVYLSTGGEIATDTPVVINGNNDNNMTIAGATENDKYNVTFDCSNNTLIVTKVNNEEPPTPVVPETLYLIGNIPGCADGMNPRKGIEMTKEGDEFSCDAVIVDASEGFGWFSFCTKLADDDTTDEEAWGQVNSYDRFGPENEVAINDPNQPVDFVTYKAGYNASACASYKIQANQADHHYHFLMDFANNKLRVQSSSGINELDAESAGTPVYFNLQGQRVENPSNGVFIRVVNGKASKTIK